MILIVMILIMSCGKSTNDNLEVPSKWELISYTEFNEKHIPETAYVLSLEEDNKVELSLDVNNCTSTYNLNGNLLKIGQFSCTEICCDTDFAEMFMKFISKEFSMEVSSGNLILIHNEGGAAFKKVE